MSPSRILLLLVATVVLFCGLAATTSMRADAQPRPDSPPTMLSGKPVPRSATVAGKDSGSRDAVNLPPQNKRGGGIVVAFWGCAVLAIAGSLFVVTRRNLITAVMGMVGTFFAIAALYMMLYASFLAIIQMLVYAGAIMVLFVFVIMILNKPEDEPYGGPGKLGKLIAGAAVAYLLFRICSVLIDVPALSNAAKVEPPVSGPGYQWGSTASVGWSLFNDYLFPFEAVSILLLIAVVGAIAIARPLKDDVIEDAADDGAGSTPVGAGGHP